jgi:hypothetical protein
MAIKSLHQIFNYHRKYLNSMKWQEISMGPSIRTIQCTPLVGDHANAQTLTVFNTLDFDKSWMQKTSKILL